MLAKLTEQQIAAALVSLRATSSARERDAAVTLLLPLVRHLVRRYARLNSENRDLDDIYQLATIAVVESAGDYDETRPACPWLNIVVRRKVGHVKASIARVRRTQLFRDLDIVGDERSLDTPEEIVEDYREHDPHDAAALLDDALNASEIVEQHTSELERIAWTMTEVGDLSYDDVAAATGATVKQVDNAMQRARRKLGARAERERRRGRAA